ncbi:hypothetical protein TrST_g1215 [Triparma strigata]|uniref:YwbE family protein n=1 Tax=Triparma strigata TaxID=1606541 RepID=A0A9W7A7B6_9STRA|nr:hypothetical protein TrST_g1215 [Triparma strigata]
MKSLRRFLSTSFIMIISVLRAASFPIAPLRLTHRAPPHWVSSRTLSILFNDPNNPKPPKAPVPWGRASSNWDAHSFPSSRKKKRGAGGRGGRQRRPPPPEPEYGEAGRGCFGKFVTPGCSVMVVKKEDQRTGIETRGIVQRLLTNAAYHPRGIKVMLVDGTVGRIAVLNDEQL